MRRGHEVLQFSCQGNTCLCHISSSDLLPLPVARFLCYRTRKTFLLNKRTPTIHWHPYQVLAIFPAWILCLWRWCAGEIFEDASFPFDLPPFNCKFILIQQNQTLSTFFMATNNITVNEYYLSESRYFLAGWLPRLGSCWRRRSRSFFIFSLSCARKSSASKSCEGANLLKRLDLGASVAALGPCSSARSSSADEDDESWSNQEFDGSARVVVIQRVFLCRREEWQTRDSVNASAFCSRKQHRRRRENNRGFIVSCMTIW